MSKVAELQVLWINPAVKGVIWIYLFNIYTHSSFLHLSVQKVWLWQWMHDQKVIFNLSMVCEGKKLT